MTSSDQQSVPSTVAVKMAVNRGDGLFSLGSFQRGDTVFSEYPLVISSQAVDPLEQTQLKNLSDELGFDFSDEFLFVKSFCAALPATQEAVLSLFAPDDSSVESSSVLKSMCRLVEICKKFDWAKPFQNENIKKVILVKVCNAHGFNYNTGSSAALYFYGSKMNHSCKPNIVYTSQRLADGRGSFIAKENVQPGDELFISYIDTFLSTPMRQKKLMEGYAFKCSCDLCTVEIDRFRGLHCPACPKGTIFRNNATASWQCDECHQAFADSTKGISNEEESGLIADSESFLHSFESRISQRLEDHILMLRNRLGSAHAATKLAEKTFIECVLLDRKHSCDELISLTDEILEWTNDDPSFLDSLLIQIGCHIARSGDEFEKATKYLKIVEQDLLFLTGGKPDLEQLEIVQRAISACERKDADSVPNLVSPNEACVIQ